MVGKNNYFIGRSQAQVHQRKLILLGQIPAHPHVVHWTCAREDEVKEGSGEFVEYQASSWRKTFKRVGRGKSFVEREQFMQKRRAGSPVTNDEDRGFLDHAGANASPEGQLLDNIKTGIQGRHEEADQDEKQPAWGYGKAVAKQQAQPG